MERFIRKTLRLSIIIFLAAICPGFACLYGATLPGLISAGETTVPPSLDGKFDEDCWKNAIEITPFIKSSSMDKKASEQTKAYICYDKKNLYLAFYCVQGCLDPVQNQLHAFRKNCTANDDDKLFDDDWLVVLLQPDLKKNSFFNIFINANGAVNDDSCSGSGPNSWNNRDRSWSSGITAKSYLGDGFWTMECAIPFEKLKIAHEKNMALGFEMGRRNSSGKETSIWQPMQNPFHDPDSFGRLVLGDTVPQVRDIDFSGFTRGKNTMSCSTLSSGKNFNLRLENVIFFTEAKTAPERHFRDFEISGKKALVLDYSLEKEGTFSVQFGILNPLNLKTLYRTPAYQSSVKSSMLKAAIAGEAACELYLNGEKITGEGFLLKGENVLCIKTDGPVKGAFAAGDMAFPLDCTWKYSPASAEGWKTKTFKDAGWTFAQAENGQFKEKGFYRKSIVLNSSRFWPNWGNGGISIAQNGIQQLFMVPEGLEGKTLDNYVFYLEVPEEFEVIGASSYYKGKDYAKNFSLKEKQKIIRNNKNYIRYSISTETPVKFNNKLGSYQFVSIPVRLPEQKGLENKMDFYYYMSAGNGNIAEVPQKLAVNVLPPLKGAQPSKYVVQLWSDWLSSMSDVKLKETLLKSFADNGFNEVVYSSPLPSAINLRNTVLIDFNTWNIDCVPYLKEHLDEAVIDIKNNKHYDPSNPRKNHICTTMLLENSSAWDYVEKRIEELIKKNAVKHINWDYENSVWDDKGHGYICCFCPRCIAKFRDFAKIPQQTELDSKIIRSAYRQQWIVFMDKRMADLAGKFRNAVKKVSGDITFSVYSAYQSEQSKEEYGIDWAMLADKVDYAMCGYGRSEKELKDTLAALGKTPIVIGELVYPYNVSEDRYPHYASKAILLRRVSDGTGGILIYSLTQLDGRTFYAAAEISRLVKEYESLFLSRKKDNSLVEVSGINQDNAVVFTDGKTRLIMLINEDKVSRKVTVTNRNLEKDVTVYDYFAGKDLGNQEKINAEILPDDVKVFIVKSAK